VAPAVALNILTFTLRLNVPPLGEKTGVPAVCGANRKFATSARSAAAVKL
jgi:hypothetical protein